MLVPLRSGTGGGGPTSGDVALGFALNFMSGRGLLTTRDRRVGPLLIKSLALEIPNIAFPFDVTGGAERFKPRRCILRHLAMSLDASGLEAMLAQADLASNGLRGLKLAVLDGHMVLAGVFAVGEVSAEFTCRVALLPSTTQELQVVFYDTRVYGWLPLPAALVPVYLRRALPTLPLEGRRAGVWIVRPAERFMREVMPRAGWKIPDMRHAPLVAAEVVRGQVNLFAGPSDEPTARQIAERTPPPAAVAAAEGITAYGAAEEALAVGDIREAYTLFRDALDEGRGGSWVRERLLQIGAADPELTQETKQLADEVLLRKPNDVAARLALGAMAQRDQIWNEAAQQYIALAVTLRERKERHDWVAAELAAGRASAPVDQGAALQAFERAAARAADSPAVFEQLFLLRQRMGKMEGAAEAGERWLTLVKEPAAVCELHCRVGNLYLHELHDFKRARLHFEKALRLVPEAAGALEGLAETYAARGEPGRAASYLARLAEQAEQSQDAARIVALNLRLGDIWQKWLHDPESATARYHRVLDVMPRHLGARLQLASLAEARNDLVRARAFYQDIVALDDESSTQQEAGDFALAYSRLADLLPRMGVDAGDVAAYLERAAELQPDKPEVRAALLELLRRSKDWPRLVRALDEQARLAQDPQSRRAVRLEAARIELQERRSKRAARAFLEQVLAEFPADDDALALILPLLESQSDRAALLGTLQKAANASADVAQKAEWFFRVASLHTAADQQSQRREALEAALNADPGHLEAARGLVELLAGDPTDPEALAAAYAHLGQAANTPAARAKAQLQRAGVLFTQLGDAPGARQAAEGAVREDPHLLEAWLLWAEILESSGQGLQARQVLETARTQLGEHAGSALWLRLAELAKLAGDNNAEVQYLQHLVQLPEATGALRERLAQVLVKLQRNEEAATLWQHWAEHALMPAGAAFLEAGRLRATLGDDGAAAALFKRAMESGAGLEAAAALERTARAQGQWEEVVASLHTQLQHVATDTDMPRDAQRDKEVELLARLLSAQLQGGDGDGAFATSSRLVEKAPQSVMAHQVLAQKYEERSEWDRSLDHLLYLLLVCAPEELARPVRRNGFIQAAALAAEIRSDALAALREAFVREFPEAQADALQEPLGARLASMGAWDKLLALRTLQLPGAKPQQAISYHREIGDILYRRLDRPDDAVVHYREVAASDLTDVASRAALADIFTKSARWRELAQLQYGLSHLLENVEQALACAVQSAELYADVLDDPQSAVQNLRSFLDRGDVPLDHELLFATLERLGMYGELAQLLENGLSQGSDPDDPRFERLCNLLAGPLKDPGRALAWSARMVETFPESDTARRVQLDLVRSFPALGDAAAVLHDWAAQRSGGVQAALLVERAELLQDRGALGEAVEALAAAHAADPEALRIVDLILEVLTVQGDFASLLTWLQKAADLQPEGPERDARLRRIVDVATDLQPDPVAARAALQRLSSRSEDDVTLLVQLYRETNDVAGLASLHVLDELPESTLLDGARQAANALQLPEARRFLEAVLRRGHAIETVWQLATEVWGAAGQLAELGRWRLDYAAKAPQEHQRWLKMLAHAELLQAEAPPAGVVPSTVVMQMGQLDLDIPTQAWATFTAARGLQQPEWMDKAAQALEDVLADDDARLPVVLRPRGEMALARGDNDAAVQAARRLISLGDASAVDLLETALTRAGRLHELIELLQQRAEQGGKGTSDLWVRLAEMHQEEGDHAAAHADLGRVPAAERSRRWGEVQFAVAETQDDTEAVVVAAQVCAEHAPDAADKANWLRVAARAVWWAGGDEIHGRELLQQAQELEPWTVEHVLRDAAAAAPGDREKRLEEGVATLGPGDHAKVYLALSQHHAEQTNTVGARIALNRALRAAQEQPDELLEVAQAAEARQDNDTWLGARRRLYELMPRAHVRGYATVLRAGKRHEDLATLLETAVEQELGEPAQLAAFAQEAAQLAREALQDGPRALRSALQAARLDPNEERLRMALELATAANDDALIVELATPLAQLLPDDHTDLPVVLRQLLAVQETANDMDAALTTRARLVALGQGTAADKLAVARTRMGDDPLRAAQLLEQAATDGPPGERGMTYLQAARSYQQAGDTEAATRLLQAALESGLEDASAVRMAVELAPAGPARLPAIERLLAVQADKPWQPDQRAAVRLELAESKLQAGQAEAAATWLVQAGELHATSAWAKLYEQALEKLNKPQALLTLWLTHADLWEGDEKVARLRRAASMARQTGTAAEELAALDGLQTLAPEPGHFDRMLELAATLQDRERFGALLARRYQDAPDVAARVALALRAAPLWLTHFNDPAKAAVLLEDALAESVEASVVETLRDLYLQQKRALEFVELLRRRAASLQAGERIGLLSRAADIAAGNDAPAVAFELYLELLRQDPTLGHAAEFCLQYGRRVGRWPEVLEVLQRRAKAVSDGNVAAGLWEQAADVARDGLVDATQELQFLREAVDRQPNPERLARLVRLHMGADDWQAAANLLLEGEVDAQQEQELALQVIQQWGAESSEAEALLAWVSDRYPDAPEAVAYRLRRARAAGDLEAVLQALLARLAGSDLTVSERMRLHCEAAEAAIQLRRAGEAAQHWMSALEAPEADVAILVKAHVAAEQAGDVALQQRILERAASARQALANKLEAVKDAARAPWLSLLGSVYEATGDDTLAVEAYQELCNLAQRRLPPKAVEALTTLYERYGQWEPLAALYERQAELTAQPAERAELLYTLGVLYRDRLMDEDHAVEVLTRAVQTQDALDAARLDLGLLLVHREQYADALPLLEAQVDVQSDSTPMAHLVALVTCYHAQRALAEAIDLSGLILAREPDRQPMRRMRAEMLQEAGRMDDARAEWEAYLSAMRADDPPEALADVHQRIGRLARRSGDNETALRHLEEVFELQTPTLALMGTLRELYEESEQWKKAADMRNRELALETEPGAQLVHFRALAELYDQRLDDAAKAVTMLERAADVAPRDVALLQELLERYNPTDDRPKFLLCAERLLTLMDESDLDANFFIRLAEAYEPVDAARAQTFYSRALELDPSLGQLRGKQRDMALQAGDYSTFANAEEDAIAQISDPAEKAKRSAALADTYLQHLNNVDKAVTSLVRACSATPGDEQLWRKLADAYALDARYYDKAMELYRRLLAAAPLDGDMLRIVARLAGQMGQTDRAYGYYACLLALQPGDDEALRFANACRGARLPLAPRAPNDAERAQGLTHQQQGGPIEELFAPLARFAELTHPGDLAKRGVTAQEKLTADAGRALLVKMAALFGLAQIDVCTWPNGGGACDVELLNPPVLLLGQNLRAAGLERQLLFLATRSAELYRSGHTLCERLQPADLQSLVSALCVAVDANSKPPGATPQTAAWARTIASPMTVQIRAAMAPRVAAYLKVASSVDVGRWRQASMISANRVAMVMVADVDEAITALLRSRGKTDAELAKPRAAMLKDLPEEMDLFRFAQSEQYFNLRQNMGVALRRSK